MSANRKLPQSLADARPRRLDPDRRPDPATVMGHPRSASASRPVRRPARRLVLAGLVPAAAAVAAGAVFLSSNTASPSVAKSGGPATEASPAPRSARELLLVAASHSAASATSDGRYWVLREELGSRIEVGPAGRRYDILLRLRMEMWLATRPGEVSLAVEQQLGAVPADAEDNAAWRADGSPTQWPIPRAKGNPRDPGVYEAAAGPRSIRRMEGHTAKNNFLLGGHPVTPDELAALPTDPAALKAWLVKRFRDIGVQEKQDYALFWNGKALVMDLPVAPEVRAAAYRMMADISGVKLLGTVTDQRGHPGMAVTYTREGDGGAGETQLVIDPHTGQALAEEHRNAAGELTSYTLVDSAGFSDDAPES
jgi:hypothetical protein